MNLERVKTLTDIATAWLGVIALISGGLFAIYQYLQTEKASKVKETLSFLKQFNEAPIFDARKNISMARERNDELLEAALNKNPFSEQDYDNVILNYEKREGLLKDIYIIFDFFDILQVCADKKICDVETTELFFKEESCALFHQHHARVMLERKKRNDEFAKGVMVLCKQP